MAGKNNLENYHNYSSFSSLHNCCLSQPIEFGWKIVVGSVIGFLGAAFGSVGGVGGGGIFVPMLRLIIGFDAKSSTALSKCKNERTKEKKEIFQSITN